MDIPIKKESIVVSEVQNRVFLGEKLFSIYFQKIAQLIIGKITCLLMATAIPRM